MASVLYNTVHHGPVASVEQIVPAFVCIRIAFLACRICCTVYQVLIFEDTEDPVSNTIPFGCSCFVSQKNVVSDVCAWLDPQVALGFVLVFSLLAKMFVTSIYHHHCCLIVASEKLLVLISHHSFLFFQDNQGLCEKM